MSSRRFGRGKGKRADRPVSKKFDPSPLIGDVDLSRKDFKLYLVKMPADLAKQFEDPSKGVVGRMRFAEQKDGKKVVPVDTKLRIETNDDPFQPGTQPLDNPVEKLHQTPEGFIFVDKVVNPIEHGSDKMTRKYQLFLQHSNTDIAVFSGNVEGAEDDMRIEGVVKSQYHAQPVMTDAFRRLNKHRSQAMNKKTSVILPINEGEMRRADLFALRPNSMNETMKDREERKKQKEESRRHLDVPDEKWREGTRAHIFKAFEFQPYYTADELAQTIGETTTRIRPVITEVCQYNKSGPFAARYELKDEYKTVKQREQKEQALEDHRLAQLELQKKRKEERDREREKEKGEGSQPKKPRIN